MGCCVSVLHRIFASPLLVIAIAGAFLGAEAARGEVVGEIRGLLGQQGAEAIQAMLQNTQQLGSGSIVATVVGVGALLLGASGVFRQSHSWHQIHVAKSVFVFCDGARDWLFAVGFSGAECWFSGIGDAAGTVVSNPGDPKSNHQLCDFVCGHDGVIRID